MPYVDFSLVGGVVPAVLTGSGVLASAVLLARRRRTWRIRVLPAAAGGTRALRPLIESVRVLRLPSRGSRPWPIVGRGRVAVFAVAWL